MQYFSILDFLYGPIAFIIIVIFARARKYSRIKEHPEYKYYTKGLYVKLLGGIAMCLIYSFYYGGGDTVNYYNDGLCMMRLMFYDFSGFLVVIKEGLSLFNYFYFTQDTGYPIYYKDPHTFFVVRVASIFVFLAGGSFIVTTLFFAYASYGGIWRLYKLFVMEFPELKKEMAIAILFIPSVFFWGSGIMKDTITLSAIGYYTYSFYMLFIRKENKFTQLVTLLLSAWFIISIKPYIIFALLPGSLIWFVKHRMAGVNNTLIKYMLGPFMLLFTLGGGYLLLANMSGVLGLYSVDKVLERAVITNKDLKSSYYEGNSFDIGDFDATVPSMLQKAPVAINVAIFRPYLWEAKNIVMMLSGFESLLILIFTIRVILKLRIIGIFPLLMKNHLLTFSLIFSIFFAFSIGISTSNFGSMVRYRIPVLPFFVASLFILDYFYKNRHTDIKKLVVEKQEESKAA